VTWVISAVTVTRSLTSRTQPHLKVSFNATVTFLPPSLWLALLLSIQNFEKSTLGTFINTEMFNTFTQPFQAFYFEPLGWYRTL